MACVAQSLMQAADDTDNVRPKTQPILKAATGREDHISDR